MSDNRMKSYEGIYTRLVHNSLVKQKIKVRVNERLASFILKLDLIMTSDVYHVRKSI